MTSVIIHGGEVQATPRVSSVRADILVQDSRITAVGTELNPPPGATRIDASNMIIIPGLINAHTHGHNNLSRGHAGGRWTLEHLVSFGAAVQSNRTAEDHYLSAALGAIEMLATGVTSAYDLYMAMPAPDEEVLEAVVAAYSDVGLRVVLAPSLADGPFYAMMPGLIDIVPTPVAKRLERLAALPTKRSLEIAEAAIRRFQGAASGRVKIAVSPSIPGLCSDDLLRGMAALARKHGVGMHTHISESRVEAVQARQRWGRPMVSQLELLDALPELFTAAHGVFLERQEIRTLADAGASVVHNPASNLRLGNGIAPVRAMLDAGLNVALGTDGSLCSDNQNLFEAMRFAALVSRADTLAGPASWIDAEEALERATVAGAQAIGEGTQLGTIEPGSRADLVMLRADSTFLKPRNNLLNALVFAETGAAVSTVLVDGRVVLDQGRVVGVDEQAIRERAQERAEQLNTANAGLYAEGQELYPYIVTQCSTMIGAGEHRHHLSDDASV